MKKILFGTAMLAVLALVGCDKKQSELNLDAMQGVAKVTGRVTYDAGYAEVNGTIVSKNVVPREGVQMILSVPFNDYCSGDGNKQFFATTDADGRYVFEIPVGAKALANAKVEAIAFEAPKGFLVDGKVALVSKAMFDQGIAPKNVVLENAKILVKDFDITSTAKLDENKLTGEKKFTIDGVLKIDACKWIGEEVSKGVEQKAKAAPAGTLVKIELSHKTNTDAATLTYTVKVGEGGVYSLAAPFFDAWSFNDVTVEATAVAFYAGAESEVKFANLHTSDEDATIKLSQSLTGIYEEAKTNDDVTIGELIVELGMHMSEMIMKFTPDAQTIKGYTLVKYKDSDDNKFTYKTHVPSVCQTNWGNNNNAGEHNMW